MGRIGRQIRQETEGASEEARPDAPKSADIGSKPATVEAPATERGRGHTGQACEV